jgi:hypothetical protein
MLIASPRRAFQCLVSLRGVLFLRFLQFCFFHLRNAPVQIVGLDRFAPAG